MRNKPSTQEIPAWSANLCTNAPASWRDDLRAEAKALGISFGELLRQLLVIGAAKRLPALAKKLRAAHQVYYPTRQLMAGLVCLGTLLLGSSVTLVVAHHHHNDLRGGRLAIRTTAKVKHEPAVS